MIINQKKYEKFKRVYFIAEIGINHNGSIDIAKEIIKMVALYGGNAVKFQKRDPKKLWTADYLNTSYNNEYSFGKTYGEHKELLEFNEEQYFELKDFADKYEIDFLVSAFDIKNFDFIVNELKVPAVKIPSPFITHIPYLKHVAKCGLPIFLSTGMHSIEEIDRAIEILKNDDAEYVLMQCTSIYPLKERDVNLWILKMYSERYNCEVGYSGHDTGVIAPAISAVLGALVIEKHVTLDRAMKGPDHAASLENRGLDLTIKYIKSGLEMLGSKDKKILNEEFRSREKYCFSVRAQHDIKEGEDFTEENITLKSPKVENGRDYYELLGQKAEKNYKKDDLIL